MIIRSKDKVQVNGKNKPVWVLDTDALTVIHNTADAEPSVTTFSSEHIKYHLYYSAEYRLARLRKLVNDGEVCIRINRQNGSNLAKMIGLLEPWEEMAQKYRNGKITREEYDDWRYRYPRSEAEIWEKRRTGDENND